MLWFMISGTWWTGNCIMPSLLREMRDVNLFPVYWALLAIFQQIKPVAPPGLKTEPVGPPGPTLTLQFPLWFSWCPRVGFKSPTPPRLISVLPVMLEHSPVPIPLTTAPSTSPVVTALFVGALWGARLGKNRQLLNTRSVTHWSLWKSM